jgi:antitoxin component of MazEF toxin-antitoxin module
MVTAKLRRVGNSFVVTVPREEIERKQLKEGQLVSLEVNAVEVRPVMSPDVREAFEASWQRNEAGYRYLAGR